MWAFLIPPVAEKISGVQDSSSTSLTLWLYDLHFSHSVRENTVGSDLYLYDLAKGLKTFTSKLAFSDLTPQKPRAWMSRWALSVVIADWCFIDSPDRGCKSGSVTTSWHTSARSWAVRSCSSLWHWIVGPPCGQFKAWLTEKSEPHTHSQGRRLGCHPYQRASASQNADVYSKKHPLWWVK